MTLACFQAAAETPSPFIATRAALAECHVAGSFRIHYGTEGPHAVDPTDRNGNKVPDQIEDCAVQVHAARLLFINTLGFPDPLKSPRYEGVTWIDIHLLNRDTLGTNGLAYDEIQRFGHRDGPADTRSLCFDMATSVQPAKNLTPAHEYFHLIQNGATFFKNRWFTEGTARWSERALGEGGVGKGLRGSWPPKAAVLGNLDGMAYEAAAQFWEPLVLAHDQNGRIPGDRVPAELKTMRYSDGNPVLKDLELNGWELVRDILLALGEADDLVAAERGLTKWPEDEQKSPLNTPRIRCVVESVLEQQR